MCLKQPVISRSYLQLSVAQYFSENSPQKEIILVLNESRGVLEVGR